MHKKFKIILELYRLCLSIFRHNKKLLIFLFINFLNGLMFIILFLLPVYKLLLNGLIEKSNMDILIEIVDKNVFLQHAFEVLSNITVVGYIIIYLFMVFFSAFINVAFYSELLKAINGQRVFIIRGFKTAIEKKRAILLWSLLSGTVGVIIGFIEDIFDSLGGWIAGLLGYSWSIATVFAIPVLIREEKQSNPFNYLKCSTTLIRRTWGEGFLGFFSMATCNFLLLMVCLFAPLLLGVLLALISQAVGLNIALGLLVSSVLIAPPLIFVVTYLQSQVTHIFRCTLYVYASEGVVPTRLSDDVLLNGFKVK